MTEKPIKKPPIKAEKGTLTFMVGGNKNEFQYAMPLLNILGDNILHIGSAKHMPIPQNNNTTYYCNLPYKHY